MEHLVALMDEGLDESAAEPKALMAAKREEQEARNRVLAARDAGGVDGVFEVAVVDPPWPIEHHQRSVRPNQPGLPPYPTMSVEEIAALEVPVQNGHCWLWTTNGFLRDAFEVLEAWGFEYRSTFVWHKNTGFQTLSGPQYRAEFILHGVKGDAPPFADRKQFFTVFDGKNEGHSIKPGVFYDLLDRVHGDCRKVDVFARSQRDGWATWGNEAGGDE